MSDLPETYLHHPIIGKNETLALIADYQQTKNVRSREKLVAANMRFVVRTVRQLETRYQGTELEDLVHEGVLGLMHAIEEYNAERVNPETGEPYSFLTYASWWIRQSADRAGMSTDRNIRIPVHTFQKAIKYTAAKLDAEARGQTLTAAQIAEIRNGVTDETWAACVNAPTTISANAIISAPDEREYELLDTFADPCDLVAEHEGQRLRQRQRQVLMDAMTKMKPRQASVLMKRLGMHDGDPKTFKEIGELEGVTHQAAQLSFKSARRKLEAELLLKGETAETIL